MAGLDREKLITMLECGSDGVSCNRGTCCPSRTCYIILPESQEKLLNLKILLSICDANIVFRCALLPAYLHIVKCLWRQNLSAFLHSHSGQNFIFQHVSSIHFAVFPVLLEFWPHYVIYTIRWFLYHLTFWDGLTVEAWFRLPFSRSHNNSALII